MTLDGHNEVRGNNQLAHIKGTVRSTFDQLCYLGFLIFRLIVILNQSDEGCIFLMCVPR